MYVYIYVTYAHMFLYVFMYIEMFPHQDAKPPTPWPNNMTLSHII